VEGDELELGNVDIRGRRKTGDPEEVERSRDSIYTMMTSEILDH